MRLTTDVGQSGGGLLKLPFLDKVARRLWQNSEASTENQSPEELDRNRDTVRSSIETLLRGVDDTVREEDANGDAELVARNERTTDLLRCDFLPTMSVEVVYFQAKSRSERVPVLRTDMYRMTIADMKPTPKPQISLPATMRPRPVEAVSRIHPTVKTKQPAMMVHLLPIMSAKSPAMIYNLILARFLAEVYLPW